MGGTRVGGIVQRLVNRYFTLHLVRKSGWQQMQISVFPLLMHFVRKKWDIIMHITMAGHVDGWVRHTVIAHGMAGGIGIVELRSIGTGGVAVTCLDTCTIQAIRIGLLAD